MIGRFDNQFAQPRCAGLVMAWTRILGLCIGLALFGCSSNPPAEQTTTPENDPALSTDPAVAEQAAVPVNAASWTWIDQEQRWQYSEKMPPQVAMDAWTYERDAIRVRVIAPPQLNLFQNRPHALVLRVIQLTDRKPFNDRRQTTFGLQELLSLDNIDPAVVAVSHQVILPGSDQVISIDRQQNARFVGIVAGYFQLDGRRATRMTPITGMDDTPIGGGTLSTLTFGMAGEPEPIPPRPARLKMLLQLGTDQIDGLRIYAQ